MKRTATPPVCPYCGQVSQFSSSSAVVYRGMDFGPLYVCSSYPTCDAYVGCHPGTKIPLGRLANKELREAKKAAHHSFDRLWKAKVLLGARKKAARNAGYHWLSEKLGVPIPECHIGMFDVENCKRVVEVCRPFLRGAS